MGVRVFVCVIVCVCFFGRSAKERSLVDVFAACGVEAARFCNTLALESPVAMDADSVMA